MFATRRDGFGLQLVGGQLQQLSICVVDSSWMKTALKILDMSPAVPLCPVLSVRIAVKGHHTTDKKSWNTTKKSCVYFQPFQTRLLENGSRTCTLIFCYHAWGWWCQKHELTPHLYVLLVVIGNKPILWALFLEVYEIRPSLLNLPKFSKFIRGTAAICTHVHQ